MQGLPANFWRLWGSSAASNLADGLFFIAMPLLAVRLTDSPILIAGLAIAGRLPWLRLRPGGRGAGRPTGSAADHAQRPALPGRDPGGAHRRWRSVDGLSLPILYVAAFALGVGETLFDTAAQSILPSIVRQGRSCRGPTAGSTRSSWSMNQFVGPPLGGVLIGISVPLVLASSIVGYALAAVGLTLHRRLVPPAAQRPAHPDHHATSPRACATCGATGCCARWRSWSA